MLSGLVFDERGNAFSSTHAVKNGKRYRYYVNQALIQFRPEDAGVVHRIAAHEGEQLLCRKLQHLFHDPTQLADLLEIPNDDRETLVALQIGAGRLALAWENIPSSDRKILVQRIVIRMVILSTRVDLQISWQGLADAVGVPAARNGQADTFVLSLDAQFRRIGGETKLVLQGLAADPPASQSDPVLLNALAQAHAWSELYRRDPTLPMAYFATRARVSESYATRILRLACLAPDIVEAIVAGKQPRSLTLKRLLRGIPLCWAEQRERFGLRQA